MSVLLKNGANVVNELNYARQKMVFGQIQPNKVNDETIINALSAVPRENFVPKAMHGVAYIDRSIQISEDRFVMEPMVVARMMQESNVSRDDLVLVVGAGSGYEAALLGQCADAVVALEQDQQLAAKATENLLNSGSDNVAVVDGKLTDGVSKQGPFDLIFINGAVEEIPHTLLEQLAEGGKIVTIRIDGGVAHSHIIEKHGKEFVSRNIFEADASLLPGFERREEFVFS